MLYHELYAIAMVGLALVSLTLLLGFVFWMNWRHEALRGDLCPYTGKPMRLGMDVAHSVAEMVHSFLEELGQTDNPPIDFSHAAYCPETGRIFPDCISSKERISLSWDFITKRCSGTFVSWGSLSPEEQGELKLIHSSLEGFQLQCSSSRPRPEDIEADLAVISPGPLYVDRISKILVGWKKVPGTYFEVLVVQRPLFRSIEETL